MKRLILPLLVAALAAAVALPAPAPAIVAPKTCKSIRVDGKKHRIKADGVTCRFARSRARTYLESGRKPSGWRCVKNPSTLRTFDCDKGYAKTFYGLKPR